MKVFHVMDIYSLPLTMQWSGLLTIVVPLRECRGLYPYFMDRCHCVYIINFSLENGSHVSLKINLPLLKNEHVEITLIIFH